MQKREFSLLRYISLYDEEQHVSGAIIINFEYINTFILHPNKGVRGVLRYLVE